MKLALLATLLFFAQDSSTTDGRSTARGGHFEVVCHFENDVLAAEALRSVEALWPVAAELYDLDQGKLDELLQVNLYRTGEDFDRVDQELTSGSFQKNQSFAHWRTRTVHVALQPAVSDENLALLGLPAPTRRLLIHEAAHLARFTAFSNYRSHPDWLVHGAASWIDGVVMEALGRAEAFERDPESSTSIARVQRLLERGELPGPDEIFEGMLGELSFTGMYDVTGLFFRFLAEGKSRKNLSKVLAKARQLGG